MKSLLVVALTVFGSTALACPDFTGSFVNSSGEFDIDLEFTQKNCTSAVMTTKEGEFDTYLERFFDGKLRPTYETDRVLFQESEVWDGDRMLTVEDYFWKSDGTHMQTKGVYKLDEQKNLVIQKDTWQKGELIGRYSFFYKRK